MPVKSKLLCVAALVACQPLKVPAQDQAAPSADEQTIGQIIRDVRKELVTLPNFGVFDHLWFGLKDRTVVLRGYASRPTLKSSAENVVKKVKNVEAVTNEIEVLPVSPNDDRIRAAVYARIYGHPSLQRYTSNRGGGRNISRIQVATGITNNPPIGYHAIRIIVKNGEVTLFGIVDNEGDFAIAEMQARMTPGTFTIFNELEVAKEDKSK